MAKGKQVDETGNEESNQWMGCILKIVVYLVGILSILWVLLFPGYRTLYPILNPAYAPAPITTEWLKSMALEQLPFMEEMGRLQGVFAQLPFGNNGETLQTMVVKEGAEISVLENVNVRNTPGSEGAVLTTLQAGTVVVTGSSNVWIDPDDPQLYYWVEIQTQEGIKGYLATHTNGSPNSWLDLSGALSEYPAPASDPPSD